MSSKNYPNLSENEINWLVESASLRTDANVKDLIDSFFQCFPDRATHDGKSLQQIRDILTSRFNDILYRKDRGYTQIIAEKRTVYQKIIKAVENQEIFIATFSVLNPVSLLNFHEQIFTNPKSKPSDKFKSISAAEALKVRMAEDQQKAKLEKAKKEKVELEKAEKEKVEYRQKYHDVLREIENKRFERVIKQLPEALQAEVQARIEEGESFGFNTSYEIAYYTLKDKGMHAAAEEIDTIRRKLYRIGEKLSTAGLQKFTQRCKSALKKKSFDELDALVNIYIDALL